MFCRRSGYSLIGSLGVGASLALASALLFPVLVTAGERAPHASCQSNLREIGAAIMMYMEDYDGTAPLARSVEIDAAALVRESGPMESPFVLTGGPELLLSAMGYCPPLDRPGLWPLHLVLDSYTSRPGIWRDPEDRGDIGMREGSVGDPLPPSRSTTYTVYGSSYQYNQGLVWRTTAAASGQYSTRGGIGNLSPVRRDEIQRPGEVPFVFDGEGYWHDPSKDHRPLEPDPYLSATGARGYNVLFDDGSVRFLPASQLLNRAPGREIGLLYRNPRG
jgi:hypothetical protein